MYKKLLAIICLILCVNVPAWGTNYYVTTAGSDSNTGTDTGSGDAWATLAHGCSTIVAGDTLFIRAGTYDSSNQLRVTATDGNMVFGDVTSSGSSGSPIVIRNYPGDARPEIRGKVDDHIDWHMDHR